MGNAHCLTKAPAVLLWRKGALKIKPAQKTADNLEYI